MGSEAEDAWRLIGGYRGTAVAQALVSAGIANLLVEGPRYARDLARSLNLDQHLTSRVTVVEGDFFERPPSSGDVYLLCRVLPNWSDADADAVRLLSSCRRAMRPGSSLLMVDLEIPEIVAPGDFRVIGDLQAMAHFGGRIRTRPELIDIITTAGLSYVDAHNISFSSGLNMVEATWRDA